MGWWNKALEREPSPAGSSRRRTRATRFTQASTQSLPGSMAGSHGRSPVRRRTRKRTRSSDHYNATESSLTAPPLPRRPGDAAKASEVVNLQKELEMARLELVDLQTRITYRDREISDLRDDLAKNSRAYDNQHKALDNMSSENRNLLDTLRQRSSEISSLRMELTIERNTADERRRSLLRTEDAHRAELANVRRLLREQESRRDDLIRKLASDKSELERTCADLRTNWHKEPNVMEAMKVSFAMSYQLNVRGVMPPWPYSLPDSLPVDEVRVFFCQMDRYPFKVPLMLPQPVGNADGSKTCMICANDYCDPVYKSTSQWERACKGFEGPWMTDIFSFPAAGELTCNHAMNVCKSCIRNQIASHLESRGSKGWNTLSCPLCSRNLTHNEIRKFASAEDFARYERFYLIEHLSKEPDFRWCLSGTCKSGQIYEMSTFTPARIKCDACKFAMCFTHQVPWHTGQSCAEYDRTISHAEDEEKSEKWKKENTKACPGQNCGRPIQKGDGCFHMTCRECQYEFCWECLADWHEVKNNKMAHKVGCYFRTSAISPMGMRGTTINVR